MVVEGGMHGCGGVCMVVGGVHVCGRGACMVAERGGDVHGCGEGACMVVGGHAWLPGMCVVVGGEAGRGYAWLWGRYAS